MKTGMFRSSPIKLGILIPLVLALAACQPAANQAPPAVPTSAPTEMATAIPTEMATTAPTEAATSMPTEMGSPTAELPATGGTAEPTAASSEATINVATDPNLGKILVDGNGMTLYMYTKDEANKSNCSEKCLKNWPPLITQGNPVLGEGVDPALVGTATMADGSLVVTYNKMPLYTYIQDEKPGDVVGQDSNHVWYVVAPDGNPVGYTMPGSTEATQAPTAKPDY